MCKLNIGDVVYLKSGSPAMTVNRIYENRGNVECVWFVENQEKAFIFNQETLLLKASSDSAITISKESDWSSF